MGIKGEGERGHTARQPGRTHGSRQDKPRGHNRRHTAATEHTTDSRSGGQAEGRQGREERGTRMASRLGSGGGEHGSREGTGREQTDRKKSM